MLEISQPDHAPLSDDLRGVLDQAGLTGHVTVRPLPGGRNNRVFCVEHGTRKLLLKVYFRTTADSRHRLRHEFGFLQYLWSHEIRSVPEPVFADYDRDVAIYEFIAGRRLQATEVGSEHISQAVRFFHDLNATKDSRAGTLLPAASEACFSLAAHLQMADRRVERVKTIAPQDDIEQAAREFVSRELTPFWDVVRSVVSSEFDRMGQLPVSLSRHLRCLSPSDFGFHNALVDDSGTVRFIDFEYAGWDDPAKLVCDFANQPDMLLSEALARDFEGAVTAVDLAPERLAERVRWLRPVYQIKWSCIILNDFLPHGSERTRFTGVIHGRAEDKTAQLDKARRMLRSAEISLGNASGR